MNLSYIRNKKKKNNYVVNLSFDIPIKSENLALDQALAGEFTISPFQTKRKMRLKL